MLEKNNELKGNAIRANINNKIEYNKERNIFQLVLGIRGFEE